MSKILWRHSIQPAAEDIRESHCYEVYDGRLCLGRCAWFPQSNQHLVALTDPRIYRSMSRAGLLLAAAGVQARETLDPLLQRDPFSVGIYCAMEQGPCDCDTARQMAGTPAEDFARQYKSLRAPRQYLKELPNVPPSQLAIFLGIMGPQYVFQDSQHACLQALDQAEFDLQSGIVQAAVVCAAFSLEDPLLSMHAWSSKPEELSLSEGAAILILTKDETSIALSANTAASTNHFYGIAHDLMLLAGGHDAHA